MSCVVRLDTIRDSRNGYIHTRGARERLRARQRFFLSPGPARPAAGAGEAERCPRTSPAGRSRFFTSLVGPPAFLSLFAHISFTALAHAHTSAPRAAASAQRRQLGTSHHRAALCAAARVLVHAIPPHQHDRSRPPACFQAAPALRARAARAWAPAPWSASGLAS